MAVTWSVRSMAAYLMNHVACGPTVLIPCRAVNAEQPNPDDIAGCFHGDRVAIGDAEHAGRERVRSQRGQHRQGRETAARSLHAASAHGPQRPSCGARLQKPLNSKRMTKQQLIEKVAAKTELKKSEVEVAVDSVLAMIAEALQANERVDLRGFGSFVVKERKERQGRNPRTGEAITIAAKRDAGFKPSKELAEKLAHGETAPTPEVAV